MCPMMCPHSATYVCLCYSTCPHTAIYVSSLAANMPGHIYSSMRTHSAIYVSSYYSYYYRSSVFSSSTLSTATKWRRLHPRTTPKTTRLKVRSSPATYVFSYCSIYVLIILYVSSYYYTTICVLLIRRRLLAWRYAVALLYMCYHTALYMSS
jgi:hypothetical protein